MLSQALVNSFENPHIENLDPRLVLDYIKALENNPVYQAALFATTAHTMQMLNADTEQKGLDGVLERNNALITAQKSLLLHDTICNIREDIEELLTQDEDNE